MAVSKTLRNRIVGLLVIVSLIMILVPAMMSPSDIYKKDDKTIAVDSNGAVTDSSGALVSGAAEHNYNDLLEPYDDTKKDGPTPQEIAAENAQRDNSASGNAALNAFARGNGGTAPSANPFDDGYQYNTPDAAPMTGQTPMPIPELESVTPSNLASPDAAPKPASDGNRETLTASSKPAEKKSETAKPQQKPAAAQQKPAAAQKSQALFRPGTWTVQVGVFSQQSNMNAVIAKLKNAGVSCKSENITLNGKSAYRVYAGSSSTKAGAQAIAAKVEKATGSKGRVLQYN